MGKSVTDLLLPAALGLTGAGALDATGGVNELTVAGEEELRRLRDEIMDVFNDPNRSVLLSPQSRIVLEDTLAELEQKLSSLGVAPIPRGRQFLGIGG